jgi:pSer/pThr/pTyr-binding forkhead associated (FHA) protein
MSSSGEVFCNNCGHRNLLGSSYCSSCGAVLERTGSDHTTITFHPVTPVDPNDIDLPSVSDVLGSPVAVLVVRQGPKAGSRYAIESETTTVGRHPDSDIFLDDITVSRRHAEIVRNDQRFEVVDAGSLNGTYVDRRRIERAVLTSGDEIQIGKFKLVFVQGEGWVAP